jgi:glycosyltransferase involved in cell wall biosynthesis
MQGKIVVDARMINSSGIGRYLEDILPNIMKYFGDVILLGDSKQLKEKLNNSDLRVIPFNDSIYSISEQLKYPAIILSCDIFFSPHYNIPCLPIRAKRRVVTIHDVFHLAFYDTLSISQKVYSRLMMNQAMQKSDHVITVSEFSKKEILKYTNKKYAGKILIYKWSEYFSNRVVEMNPIYTPNSYFLYVGNIKPHKNLRRAVEAFRLLLLEIESSKQKPRFIIVGQKEGFITEDKDIVSFIDNDPLLQEHVVFTDWIADEELLNLYANALAFVFPSYYEGFGLPPLEAMSLGTPVIASNAASIPEVCNDAALYFDPFDINDIYDKMKCVFNSESIRNELIQKGKENVKRFSRDLAIEEHFKLFDKLLNE